MYGFPRVATAETKAELRATIQNALEDMNNKERSPLFEVVLTSRQLNVWGNYLKESLGFQELVTWLNPNTDTKLTMLAAHEGTLKTNNL